MRTFAEIIATCAIILTLPAAFVLGVWLNDSPAAQPAPVWRCVIYTDAAPSRPAQPARGPGQIQIELDHAARFAVADMRVTVSDGITYPRAARVECGA